jgi:calmodulin
MPADISLSEDEIEEIREIFSHFDVDGNGVIEHDEFGALLRTLDDTIGDDDIRAGLDALDENRNGVIDFDEFLEWWADR